MYSFATKLLLLGAFPDPDPVPVPVPLAPEEEEAGLTVLEGRDDVVEEVAAALLPVAELDCC